MTLNSFPPLKSQRVKGSRARLIAKFCLPWNRGDLLGWEGDEDAFWAEVKKTCLEEANVLTALKKRIQESVPDWVEDPSGNQVEFWLSLRELECASVSVGIVDKLRHSEILAEIIQKMGASYLPWAKNLSFSSRKGGAPQYLFDYAKLIYQKELAGKPLVDKGGTASLKPRAARSVHSEETTRGAAGETPRSARGDQPKGTTVGALGDDSKKIWRVRGLKSIFAMLM